MTAPKDAESGAPQRASDYERTRVYERPEDTDDATVLAAGKVSEAVEWVERARGRLYDFHQMIGRADFILGEAADALDEGGHHELAERLRREGVGRNVLPGRWTFQVVDEFDDLYWEPMRALERVTRERLMAGRRHVHEAEMKEERRTHGHQAHRARPPA